MTNEELDIGGFIYTLDANGNWTYKAKKPEPLKKNGNLKAVYADLPKYDVIYPIENEWERQMVTQLNKFNEDVNKLLSTIQTQ